MNSERIWLRQVRTRIRGVTDNDEFLPIHRVKIISHLKSQILN